MADEARAGGDRSSRSSEKSIQKAIQRLSARLLGCQRRLEDRKRLTRTMTFEDLGVDRTFVDLCRLRIMRSSRLKANWSRCKRLA